MDGQTRPGTGGDSNLRVELSLGFFGKRWQGLGGVGGGVLVLSMRCGVSPPSTPGPSAASDPLRPWARPEAPLSSSFPISRTSDLMPRAAVSI